MKLIVRIAMILVIISICIFAIAAVGIYSITFHPKPLEAASLVCPSTTPQLSSGQTIKVLNYNVQYFAGKDYIFYYDVENEAGPDTRPSPQAIVDTAESISALILDADPDILLLQEVHEGAKATDFQNQTDLLLSQLNNKYPCYSETFYWKADFVPHPSIMGSVGMKLVTLSKYKIESAQRQQLSLMPTDPVTQAFNLKRAILTSEFPVEGGQKFIAMNTHLDAFSQGMNTMELQVDEVHSLLSSTQHPWVIGGDFNLLPPGQYSSLDSSQQIWYNPISEISPLTSRYLSVPSMKNVSGDDKALWFTHFPNDPQVSGPDRTIDYIFYDSSVDLISGDVIQGEVIKLSDHLPVTATIRLP